MQQITTSKTHQPQSPPSLSSSQLLHLSGTIGKFQYLYTIFAILNTTLSHGIIIGLAFLQLMPQLSCFQQKNQSLYTPCSKQYACSRNPTTLYQKKIYPSYRLTKSITTPNFITQFSMQCSSPQEIGFIGSSYFIGFILSSLIFPVLADYIGRVKVMIIGALIHILAMVMLIFFAQTFYHFQVGFVYLSQITDDCSRSYFAGLGSIGDGIVTILIGLYYMLGLYYMYMCQVGIIASVVIVFLALKYLPESPVFLFQKMGQKGSLDGFRKIAQINNRLRSFNQSCQGISSSEQCQQQDNLLIKQTTTTTSNTSSKWSTLIWKMILICINWFGCIFTAYGIHMDVKYFHESMQASWILVGAGQLLSCLLFSPMVKYVGRTNSYLISGGLLIFVAFTTQYLSKPQVVFNETVDLFLISSGYLILKYFNGIMFGLMYLITSQLFESKIRSTTLGVANFFGRFGGLLAPIIVEFQRSAFMNTIVFVTIIQIGFFVLLLRDLKDKGKRHN